MNENIKEIENNNDHFVHGTSDVQTSLIGKGTKIWQFCVILKGAAIGENVNICSHCFIENQVNIGNNVTIKNGVYVYDGVNLEDNVFIGPNVAFTNDKLPRSKNYHAELLKTIVKSGASIGGGAVILPGITIGENAMVGAGAIVTKDVPKNGVVYGSAGKLKYFI